MGRIVLWRENYHQAILDFCNNIGHERTPAVQQTASLFGGLGSFHSPRKADREGRAAAGLALNRDVTAHDVASP